MSRIGIFALAMSSALAIGAAHAADLQMMPTKAPPPSPPPLVSGYLELYMGGAWNHEDEPGPSEDSHAWVIGGAGRVNYWWGPTASAQFDVQADGASYTGQTSGANRASAIDTLIAAHVNWRDQRGLLGIFAGVGDASPDEVVGLGSGNVRHGLVGGEGQLYWGMFTLYGQVGYDSSIGSIGGVPGGIDSVHAWFVRGTGRYYVNPDLRLEGTVQYQNGSHDFAAPAVPSSFDFDMLLWRAKVEYKFPHSPFAIFGAYQGTRLNLDAPGLFPPTITETVTDQRITGGVRIYLGENTLRVNDTNGATLDIIDPIGLLGPSFN